jgi:hypothetical protein
MEIKKIMITLLILVFSISFVSADNCHQNTQGVWIDNNNNPCGAGSSGASGTKDKVIASIDNCYNVSIDVTKKTGGMPIYFKGCTDKGSNLWTCDCKDTNGEYDVVMQTDATELDNNDYRSYTISMIYNTYDITKEKLDFTVKDWGDTASAYNKETTHLGSNVVTVDKIVQVNNTVYVDKIVPQIQYQDKIVYKEDPAKINAMNESLTICTATVSNKKGTITLLGIVALALAGFIGFSYFKSRRG